MKEDYEFEFGEDSELNKAVEEYVEKHDLSEREEFLLRSKLIKDLMTFGECFLDSEQGRLDPMEVDFGEE